MLARSIDLQTMQVMREQDAQRLREIIDAVKRIVREKGDPTPFLLTQILSRLLEQ